MVRIRYDESSLSSPQIIQVSEDSNQLDLYDPNYIELSENFQSVRQTFSFDKIFSKNSSQKEVFKNVAVDSINSVFQGYNSTILAYGQTGTGKTFTIEGKTKPVKNEDRGLIPRSMEKIFKVLQNRKIDFKRVIVRVSFLQIYNEQINDLVRSERNNLAIRECKKRGLYVENLSEWIVTNQQEVDQILQKGRLARKTANTKINNLSSRSHAVFIITIEQLTNGHEGVQIYSKLNLIDLAGSERIKITDARGQRLEECKKINQSLSCLGKVISFLAERVQNKHIPYRESKLTRLLENSLGGNCITLFLATVSANPKNFEETQATLKFSQ